MRLDKWKNLKGPCIGMQEGEKQLSNDHFSTWPKRGYRRVQYLVSDLCLEVAHNRWVNQLGKQCRLKVQNKALGKTGSVHDLLAWRAAE